MRALFLLALLAGCTEYEFTPSTDDPRPPRDTDEAPGPDGDGGTQRDCADQTLPGYPTSLDNDCENEIETGTFTPIVEWYKSSFATNPSSNQIMSQPIVTSVNDDNGDGLIDEDDVPDILVVTFNYGDASYSNGGTLRAISGDGSKEHWSASGAGLQGTGGAAAADIDGDGYVEIVSLTPNGAIAFEHTGAVKWRVSNLGGHISGTSDVPAISDMNGDGTPEIIAGRAILSNTGTLIAAGSRGMGGVEENNVGTCSFAVDLDADGDQELITGNAAYNYDGTVKWQNNGKDGYPAVADFDGDGKGEVVVSGQGTLRLLDTNYTLLWSQAIPGASSAYYGGPPTIADYDGDGEPEIGVASGSRYTVFEADGTIRWQATTDDSSSGNTGSAVFDFEGDGVAEVVYADQTSLWVFSGVDGSVKLRSSDHSNGTWLEYPVIADVDGDDHAEIVVPNTAWSSPSFAGFHVFGDANNSWRPGRKSWNQHAYHITNVSDDGTIPAVADLNWLTYNNFRSGDMTAGDGTRAPDLTLAQGDLCDVDCDEDRLVLWVHAGNEGASDVAVGANAKIDVYAVIAGVETFLTTVPLTSTVLMGEYVESVQIDITGHDPSTFQRLVLRIASDEAECDDTNNELVWKGPFCE